MLLSVKQVLRMIKNTKIKLACLFHAFSVVQMWQKASAAVFEYCKCRFLPQMRR